MVELAGEDSPFKQSVDNSVLLVAAGLVALVFGESMQQHEHNIYIIYILYRSISLSCIIVTVCMYYHGIQ